MQLTIPTHSRLGRALGLPQKMRRQADAKHQKNIEHITTIAGQYGYGPDSEQLKVLLDDYVEGARSLINTAYTKEQKWHDTFNPASDKHVEYRDGVPMIMKTTVMITRLIPMYGAARADIARAHLGEGWETACDKIVVDSHLTTFYEGGRAIVIFYGSGRDDWGRAANAVDALTTHAGIVIDEKDVFVQNDAFRRMPDLVLRKVDGEWKWCKTA